MTFDKICNSAIIKFIPSVNRFRRVARNSQWGAGLGVWRRSPQPLEAGGLGAKPPAAGDTGVGGLSP